MEPIVLATANPHKVAELRAIFADAGVPVVCLGDLPGHERFVEPAESGRTFEENAAIKALSYARQTGRVCLADDSGLEVDALGGAPGVTSSHYATGGTETGITRAERDAANNARVLTALAGVPPERRSARFVCAMVLAEPRLETSTASALDGTSSQPESKPGGTGFQPVNPQLHPHLSRQLALPPRVPIDKDRRNHPHRRRDGNTYFVTFRVRSGTLQPAERQVALGACLQWHMRRALVHLVTIMPDHVHMLLTPLPRPEGGWHSLADLLRSIKVDSARRINRLRGSAGSLWLDDSFNRIVRDGDEFIETWNSMVNIPVKAGLAGSSGLYPFTRAGEPVHGPQARAAGARVLFTTRGVFEGRIGLPGEVPRGTNGFGYDPLFLVAPDFLLTSAELGPDEKNRLSHRGIAARDAARAIARGFRDG